MSIDLFSRRDLLKFLSFTPTALIFNKYCSRLNNPLICSVNSVEKKNIIILLLDTLSAINLSLYGYRRATTPNLKRFAEHALVYHSHYSAGNFTVPGTASLLSGLYPWTHRANQYGGKINDTFIEHNIFNFIGSDIYKCGFSQNPYADLFLFQFKDYIDFHVNKSKYNLMRNSLSDRFFPNDGMLAYISVDGFSLRQNSGLPGAHFLSAINNFKILSQKYYLDDQYKNEYPLGLPYVFADTGALYTLEEIFLGTQSILADLPTPFFAYLHIFPPHGPYLPSRDFVNMFYDNWKPQEKPTGVFPGGVSHSEILYKLQRYDEFIASTDTHLGNLIDYFEKNGLFETSYIFITSDHGELFERGMYGHANEYLYESIIKVPLLVSTPGQIGRIDFHAPTSSIDILPTILSILGKEIPRSLEGNILPGFSDFNSSQPVFSFDSKSTPAKGKLSAFTIAMIWGIYKIIFYKGYESIEDTYELYDLKNDPEERNNLYGINPLLTKTMVNELNRKINQINID